MVMASQDSGNWGMAKSFFMGGGFASQVINHIEPSTYAKPETIRNSNKIGRNDPCACGSGKKFKKCCANAMQQA